MKILPEPVFLKIHRAFTLVEMLVVIAVIALLAALSIPFIQSSINKSNQAKCAGRLKSCMSAINSYLADTSASELVLYNYDGATEKRWNTALIAGGYLKLKDTQDPVWPVKANDISNSYGALIDGPSGLYVTYGSGSVPRGTTLRIRSAEKPAQTLVLADSNLNASQLVQYASIYKNVGNSMSINLVHNGKANAAFLDGHVEAVDGLRYKEIISRMFGTTQTVTVFENGKFGRF
jgi:prepilin-type N-terminal cleavage/methylation domain-containing protein/prepilin-type processing-associated H-X9-DG protein